MTDLFRSIAISLLLTVGATGTALAVEVPDLGLKTLDGSDIGLERYVGKGKWTLVMFWGLNCPICEQNKPQISAFHDERKSGDAEVIGVVINGMEAKPQILAAIDENPVSFPNYIAELPLLSVNFQIAAGEPFRGTPTYWLFDPKGELIAVNPGPIRKEALESFIESRRASR